MHAIFSNAKESLIPSSSSKGQLCSLRVTLSIWTDSLKRFYYYNIIRDVRVDKFRRHTSSKAGNVPQNASTFPSNFRWKLKTDLTASAEREIRNKSFSLHIHYLGGRSKDLFPVFRTGPYLAQGIWMKVIKSIAHRSGILVFM